MKKWSMALGIRAAVLLLGACSVACSPTGGPKTGTQTNWLTTCESDAECGELQCLCGACTRSCGDTTNCADLAGAACVSADDAGAIALCSGTKPTSFGLCLLPCSEQICPSGTSCMAGECSPVPVASAHVSVDQTRRFQTLVGIGVGMGYVIDEIAQHPRKAALFDAMFSETGITFLRVRNRYAQTADEDLGSTSELIVAATDRLGQRPAILLNLASPPGALKANGSSWCEANPENCTLAKLPDGSFDYGGFAAHWRASLDAYAAVGIAPEYISIQNNPNWVPAMGDFNEACRFLPTQGTVVVETDAGSIEVEYPGYAEALEAVLSQLAGLASVPSIVAPETTGFLEVADYAAALDMATVDAIGHHLYSTDATGLDLAALAEFGDLGQQYNRPLFQSEMHADALTTAVLMHASFAVEGAAVYVENRFVVPASDSEPDGLINLTADDFTLGDLYHVVRHYSRHIGPGWVRVAAESDTEEVLASSWISSETGSLVVVLTNPGATEIAVQIDSGASVSEPTTVTRTVLQGVERSAELGSLSSAGIVTLPRQSVVTVTIQQ